MWINLFDVKALLLNPTVGWCRRILATSTADFAEHCGTQNSDRTVTHQSCFTNTRLLLAKCNWMSVRQLAFYQTILITHKIIKSGRPFYLYQKMSSQHPYKTRQAADGGFRFRDNFAGKKGGETWQLFLQGSYWLHQGAWRLGTFNLIYLYKKNS